MTDKELFRETFSRLHASDTVYEEVLEMTENKKMRKGHYISGKVAAAAVLAAALGGTTVLAAVQGGFFRSIFGTKGQEDIEVHNIEADGQSWTAAAREWGTADEDAAERLVGEHVAQIGESVTVYGYTLTLDEYIIDENGCGAITYTLSNPDGLAGICDAGYGEYYMSPDVPMKEIYLCTTGGKYIDHKSKFVDSRSIVDRTQTTDTELHAVMYFTVPEMQEEGEGIQIVHSGYELGEKGEVASEEREEITFMPDSFVSSDIYTSDAGYTARISPVGIRFDGPIFEQAGDKGWTAKKLLITYTDGSVYQAKDEDVNNIIVGCYSNTDGGLSEVFNRLVDTEKIASITVNGPDGEDIVFERKEGFED